MPAPWRRPPFGESLDEGDTLVEVLIAMLIMAVLAVSVLMAVGAVTQQTATERAQATEQVILRDFAEQLIVPPGGQAESGVGYQSCATTSSYSDPVVTSGYAVTVTAVSIWNGTISSGSLGWETGGNCTDHGLQELTLEATSTKSSATESMTVLKADI